MHYYQFNIGDYRKDTAHLSLLEHGVYRQLLDQYYLTEQPINADDAKVMRSLCVRSADEVQALANILSDFFVKTEFGYIHKRCDISIADFHSKSTSSRDAANIRWAKAREANHANALLSDANVLQSQSERYAIGMPTKEPINPLTINPLTSSKTTRGSRLSIHFEPDFDFAKEQGIQDCKTEFEKFKDYWMAQGGQRATKLDWQATWRNWCRSAKKPQQTAPTRNATVLSGLTRGLLGGQTNAKLLD